MPSNCTRIVKLGEEINMRKQRLGQEAYDDIQRIIDELELEKESIEEQINELKEGIILDTRL